MFSCSSKVRELRERLSVQDGRKMGGGSQVKQVLVSTLQSTLHQGQLVAVKVDTATASGPGSQQKEVRSSLGWADRHNFKQQIQDGPLIPNCPSN